MEEQLVFVMRFVTPFVLAGTAIMVFWKRIYPGRESSSGGMVSRIVWSAVAVFLLGYGAWLNITRGW